MSGAPADSSRPVTLADFMEALQNLRRTQTAYCLVGGLAVGQWAEILLPKEVREKFDLPIRSKDIDLRASKDAAVIFAQNLRARGARIRLLSNRTPKDPHGSFSCVGIPIELPGTVTFPGRPVLTTVEALSGMPLLDEPAPDGGIVHHGSALLYKGIYLLDPCSLLICKLNALHTRPPGESGNDRIHVTILSEVIPRFITRTIERYDQGTDVYHPFFDATYLLKILTSAPFQVLVPHSERDCVLAAIEFAGSHWQRNNPPLLPTNENDCFSEKRRHTTSMATQLLLLPDEFRSRQINSLFVAILPDDASIKLISESRDRLELKHDTLGRLVRPQHFHMTLVYIGDYHGDIPERVIRNASDACQAAANAPSFPIRLDQVESFRKGSENYTPVMTGDANPTLMEFQKSLLKGLILHGLPCKRSPKFNPHVTLSRGSEEIAKQLIDPISWTVSDIVLVQSVIGQGKHIHLGRWKLSPQI